MAPTQASISHERGRGSSVTKRYFTPQEVNERIPELGRIIAYLRRLDGEFQEKLSLLKQAKVEAHKGGGQPEGDPFMAAEAELEFLRLLLQAQFTQVKELGGEVKQGFLVDFLGQIDGQEVLLCWQPGETEVRHYHGLNEGFLGRRPIPPALLNPSEP
jgi:hypothetical protein